MRPQRHARRPRPKLPARPFVAGLGAGLGLALAIACGRIGYEPLAGSLPPEGGTHPGDASLDRESGGLGEAGLDVAVDVPVEAELDATDALSEATDATPEADAPCPVSTVVDYCASIPALPAPPVIDGVLDCGPALVSMTPLFWSGPPPLPPFPAGNSTDLAVAWRPDGLYLFVDVTTPAAFPADVGSPVFYGAGVELFVDDDGAYASPPAYDKPGTIQLIATAPSSATMPSERAEGFRNAADQGPWTSTAFAAYPTATGFALEGVVAAADLGLATWTPSAGQKIGFDVAIDVSYSTASMTGPQGHRVGQYFLHVAGPPVGDAAPIGAPFADPRSFCTPTLVP
jgi:hypothetical protein